jgi:hypothetical protein
MGSRHLTAEQTSDIIRRLAEVPQRLVQVVSDLSDIQLKAVKGSDERSMAEIIAHLRASDDILAPRVYMILVSDNAPLAAFDERAWAKVAGYNQSDVRQSLEIFAARRAEFVNMLGTLTVEQRARQGQGTNHGA